MRRDARTLLVGLALALAPAAGMATLAGRASPAPAQRPSWAGPIDRVFAAFDRPDAPGCALGMFKDGHVVYERGYGSADLEHDVPITPETVFYVGSVSKQFTAMAAALAIEQGLFTLEDDVRKYVPELPDYGVPIRVRHLIHHTSGLRDVNTLLSAAGLRDETAFDNDAVLRILARQKALNFPPGHEHLYSNSGYAVLALVIERASGKSFADYANANIFGPLGMKVTHFHTDLGRLVPNRAFAYDRAPGGGFRLNTPQNERAGAGGLFTTVHELSLWDENFYTGRVGGTRLVTRLETPGRLDNGDAIAYAWGLQVATYRGLPVIEHSGSLGGYRAQVLRVRDRHFSVAILCNVSDANPAELSRRVADVFLGDVFRQPPAPPGARATRPDAAPSPAAQAAYTPADLEAFAGSYVSEELDTTYRVFAEKDALRVVRGFEKRAIGLRPAAPDEFRGAGATLRFVRDDARRVTGILLDAGRIRGITFVRRP